LSTSRNASHFNTFTSLTLLLLIVAQTFSVALKDKMHQRIPESLDHYAQAIGIVISHAKFDLRKYTGDRNTYEVLIESGFNWENHVNPIALNQAIQKAREVNQLGDERVLFSVGDIGLVDYIHFAFSLFGYKVESFLYLYFLIFLIQVMFFYWQFRGNKLVMVGLFLFLLGHSITLSGLVGAGYNLWTVHNNRFLSVLGLIPIMHVCLLALTQKQTKLSGFLGVLVQILIYIFILRCRNSAFWMVGPVLLIGGLWVLTKLNSTLFNVKKVKLWPIILVGLAVIISIIAKPMTMDAGYYSEHNLASHTFWYPVYVGLAINPEIREIYGRRDLLKPVDADTRFYEVCDYPHPEDSALKAKARVFVCKNREIFKIPVIAKGIWNRWLLNYTQRDQDGHRAVLKWLRANGKKEEHLYTFTPEDKVGYPRWFGQCDSEEKYLQHEPFNAKLRKYDSKKDFKWREMDKIMGEVVKGAAINHPFLALKTLFIIKPFFFLVHYLLNFAKIRSLSALILIITTFIYLSLSIRKSSLVEMQKLLGLIFGMFIFSMIVPIVAYPSPHTISEQAVVFTMCIFSLILYLLNKKRNSKRLKTV